MRRRRRSTLGGGGLVGLSIDCVSTLTLLDALLPYTFTGGQTIVGNDGSAAGGTYQFSLATDNGVLTLSGTTNLTITSGADGSAAMVFTAALADGNAAVAGLVLSGATPGTAVITITFSHPVSGRTITRTITVTILRLPVFDVQPAISGPPVDGTVFICSNGSTSGTLPITTTKQWRLNGSDILGETGDQYASSGLAQGDILVCRVTATNAAGSTTTDTAQLIIEAAPAFTVNPVISGVGQNGETFTLDDDGTHTGTAPITVTKQWVIIGAIDTPVSGANGDTWDSTDLEYGDAVACDVTISNLRGSVTQRSNLITISPLSITYPGSVSILQSQQPYTLTGLSVADVSPSGSYQIDIDAPNLLVTLATGFASLGLSFTIGDGTSDPYLQFTDTSLADLISAINGMIISGGVVGETELALTLTEGATADSITVVIPITISDVPSNTFYDGDVSRYLTDGASNYLTDGA